jgi:putative CocE/NonD family hydrolase
MSSSEADGAVIVYLEDVAQDGTVYYITEGQLRLIHRKVSPTGESPYCLQVPYHSFKECDSEPITPGEVVEVTFGLNPTSVLVRRGHSLRVAISGADKGTFTRVPEDATPIFHIYFQEGRLSYIDLPSK